MSANGLGPYPAYRDSGLDWLGSVPEHWVVRRIATVADLRVSNVDKHVKEEEDPIRLCNYVDVYHNDRIRRDIAFMPATASKAEIQKFRMVIGDVLLTKDSEDWTDIGVPALVEYAAADLVCGYHLAMLRPNDALLDPGYLFRALADSGVARQFRVAANGVTRYGLSRHAIRSVRIPLPPVVQQRAIVRFLDRADRRIRRYIRAKERLIELLAERKRALVHDAVTGRIDVRTGQPYPAYKDSGIEWLGKVPEHWEVRRGKAVFRCIDERSATGNEELLTVSSDRGIVPRESASVTMFKAKSYVGHKLCRPGDLVINSLWAWSRGLGVSRYHGIVSTAYGVYRVRRKSKALPDFIHPLVRSEAFNWELQVRSKGIWISRLQLTDGAFLRAPLPLPPLPEQRAIARFLDAADRSIQGHISATKRQIALMKEYRTRLIADVVTGKLDVREAAADLPETDPLAGNRDRAEAIPTESNPQPAEHDMAKEVYA